MQIPELPSRKLRDRFLDTVRTRHLRLATERVYWGWIKAYVKYHAAKSIADLLHDPPNQFSKFITAQARRDVSASTQNQAFNAILFLYQSVLGESLGELPEIERAKRPARLPDVPATHSDTMQLIGQINGDTGLALRLIYGSALRISDALRIRLKDVDFDRDEILIRSSKGDKDRVVPLPKSIKPNLKNLVDRRQLEHERELALKSGWVHLPGLLGTKYPKLHYDTQWQYLFASRRESTDPRSGKIGRHHLTPECLQSALAVARKKLKIRKRISPHSLRHASAREMERRGTPISEIQKLLGHSDVNTTLRYLGAGSGGKPKVIGPLD